ncbi:hypothetical protein [Rhodococcus tukisamuensis]|uniref:hypothetical protein n=1 Tax=Rhodococcus tukisamuensis TaxID=168276 RepID=UPI0009325AD1|nr:hypothetical protein [Rhodococcus tukisamuensis]
MQTEDTGTGPVADGLDAFFAASAADQDILEDLPVPCALPRSEFLKMQPEPVVVEELPDSGEERPE